MAIRLLSDPQVPVDLSSFWGRRRELVHLRALLGADRLVTVTGTGGVGKTRLAMELAHGAAFDFPAGVGVVELARIGSDELVGTAIAEATGAPRESQTDPLERAARRLGGGRQLLILDNCEHVVAGAAEASWQLLTQCPGLTILATSREALEVRGERVVPLLPLRLSEPTGSPGAPDAVSEAMQLFSDRAQLLDGNGELAPETAADVADICRRLDGLPLALELAAAWVPVLSLRQVRDRLDGRLLRLGRSEQGRPGRHRSIHAALDWSERLLTPAQAAAFARLSVFIGGFSLEGADAVLGGNVDEAATLELVAALVTRSLVTAQTAGEEARYRLLEPVRQYAADRLRARPDGEEMETRRLHLGHLAELAEAAEEPIIGGPDAPWMRRLDAELGNIRAALAWGFDNQQETAARLAAALLVYCRHRALYGEGAAWARQAAQSTGGRLRARALCMAGWLCSEMGDAVGGRALLDESYRLTAEGGSLPDLAMVLVARALAEYVLGDLDALDATAEEAVAVARRCGSRAPLMWALWAPGVCAGAHDDNQRAFELFCEARAIALDLGNVTWGAVLAVNVLDSAIDKGDWAAAPPILRDVLQSETAADPSNAGYLIEDAAILAIQGGDHRAGIRLLGASRADLARCGYRETPDEAKRRRTWIDAARERMDPATADSLWAEGEALTCAEALDAARAVVAEPATEVAGAGAAENTFIREGEYWSLAYAGMVARVKHSKGVRDLARLIAAPGRSVAAVDLVSAGSERAAAVPPEPGLRTEADAGELLDAEARAQYRARLADLEEAISDAERCNDPLRASGARDERAFLLAELGAAVGLAGRPRLALDPAERARKAVAWRVRDSIGHIAAAHPALGRHLRRSVRTGSFCVYDPDQPTEWRL
ncbi:MAG: ATP-binding protein [Candidatus Dormibacteria bacterium]